MTAYVRQDWHGKPNSNAPETTVRLPRPKYDVLLTWAETLRIEETVEAVALTFGFTENLTILGNLAQELLHPESLKILQAWSANPYVAHLSKLRCSYGNDSTIQARYPPLAHDGKAAQTKSMLRQLGAKIEKRHFLFCMIVNPLAGNCSAEEYSLRRSFRIWLIIQALEHAAQYHCFSDIQIQKLTSFLTQDTNHENWAIIDKALERAQHLIAHQPFTLDRFTLALGNAASELKVQSSSKGSTLFLNSLLRVAQGQCEQHEFEIDVPMAFKGFSALPGGNRLPQVSHFSDVAYQHFDLPPEQEGDEDEEPESAVLYSVDPDETPERQRLTGQSILIQTAESSHYLPWSWDKALPPEILDLEKWLNHQLVSANDQDRLGAAVVWLATRLSRSLPFVLELSISEIPEDEWCLTPDFALAHRKPPRRHNSWIPGKDADPFIEMYQSDLALEIPAAVQEIFQSNSSHSGTPADSVHHLWYHLFKEKPEIWFNTQAREHFPRLTSAMLANIQPQALFSRTGDHSLARLISAHPRAALPAACGYANWDIKAVESGFKLPLSTTSEQSETRVNLLGSLLSPIESMLTEHISKASEVLERAHTQDLITFHNTLVRYTVMALYAATGCRHLSDPFESITHFCADPPSVFINDKSDDALHSGRLVPLPQAVWRLITLYQSHLKNLAKAVSPIRAELAADIAQLHERRSGKLPLFFLLDETAKWHSLADPDIPGQDLFDWPLPPNLFRHRYAQQLARNGVDPEVIDGWMGHAERGVASYGDRSTRCWLNDYRTYQQAINEAFDRLGFKVPVPETPLPPMTWVVGDQDLGYQEPRYFGEKKRRKNRQAALKKVRRMVNEDLDLFLGGRPLEQLDDDQIQKLSNLMLLREDGLPHPQSALRYAVMIDRLEGLSDSHRTRVRRRMTVLETERSLVTDRCPASLDVIPRLEQWMQKTKKSIDRAKVSKAEALFLAATFLCIEKRLTYPALLEDVVKGANYRLIQNRKRQYLEYNENLIDNGFSQPVQRHEIDYKTATLLGYGYRIKSSVNWDKTPSSANLCGLTSILQTATLSVNSETETGSLRWILDELITHINQANIIQLPGVVPAALSGRQIATSLSLTDYFRLSEGVQYQLPGNLETELPSPDTGSFSNTVLKAEDQGVLYDNARAFFKGLHNLLNDYSKGSALEMANRIDRYSSQKKTEVSSAVLSVGYWLAARIRQGKGRKTSRHKPYAASTAETYLSALTEAFQGLAYDVDLRALDEEDITNLCADMISLRLSNNNELDYFGARLQEFFQWASGRGVAEPIWEDLDFGHKRRSVRPGLFSEHEYQSCLRSIMNSSSSNPDQAQLIAFVLILAFRFGLRAQEAIGLQRADWCKSGELTWVLVRNNKYRELKRPSSRRAVPLMFWLSDLEASVIQRVLDRHESLAWQEPSVPILCEIVDGKLDLTPLGRYHIASAISQSLKRVTGNPLISLHHARHSFYNTLAPILFGFDTPLTQTLTHQLEPSVIRKIILGQDHLPTRRSAMALARVMGHSAPNTGFKSYNRLVTEWADALTPVRSGRVRQIPNAVQVSGWSVQDKAIRNNDTPLLSDRLATPRNIAQALRLKALGYQRDRIEASMQLKPGCLAPLDWLVNKVNSRLRFKVFDVSQQKSALDYGENHPDLLIKKIASEAWIRLIDQAGKISLDTALERVGALPEIKHVPALIGRNGHLLMNQPEHCRLIKIVLELFQLPENSYGVFARDNQPQMTQRLIEHGFQVSKIDDVNRGGKPRLDTFSFDEADSRKLEQLYGGVIFSKGFAGCVRNSHELIVAMIVVTASCCSGQIEVSMQKP